jgi:uncharacterized protein YndB with AHSA1/START domain
MTQPVPYQHNPKLDLVLERVVDVPPERVWLAWTTPEQLKKWFAPAPLTTVECDIDLRPGGIFRTVMRSPEGQDFPNLGCYLEVVKNQRLVWTLLLEPGFRPAKRTHHVPGFTAIITMEPHGKGGTKYAAIAMHQDAEDAKRHADMGFHEGWGITLDQLVAMIKAS